VRPTSETVIGAAFQRWIRSHRDLPLLLNQWANVVRWEMRPRLFLRTAEFLWQEGHTAHATEQEAIEETLRILELYRSFAEDALAMPVIAGEKPPHERFPGADNTYSIEAMMQDGKALQAGTSHYLGTHFSRAQNIRYQTQHGDLAYAHTTSWGASTRLVGGVVMTHGDDDGLRLPPIIAPRQIAIVPILRDRAEDSAIVEYCEALGAELKAMSAFGEPLRVQVDRKAGRPIDKRWAWVKRGVPIICEIGGRDVSSGAVSFSRRDRLRKGDKIDTVNLPRDEFVRTAAALLMDIQASLHREAHDRLYGNIRTDVGTLADLQSYFQTGENEFRGWVGVPWSKPDGAALEGVGAQLKASRLSIRNAPMKQDPVDGRSCIFTGAPATEWVLVGRTY
jgi:prolyl-tRNA synthetase